MGDDSRHFYQPRRCGRRRVCLDSSIPNPWLIENLHSRPLLFRATSTAPVLALKNKGVFHPHGNVLSADAYARGVIQSSTDYSVYNLGSGNVTGMEGLDVAFYQGRSHYHTPGDSIPGANDGIASLWAMMEVAKGAGLSLLNDDRTHVGEGHPKDAVYFDGKSTSSYFPFRYNTTDCDFSLWNVYSRVHSAVVVRV